MGPVSAKDIVEVAGLRVRVPDARTRAGANRDLMAEGIKVKSHDDLLAAIKAADLPADDAEFVAAIDDTSKLDNVHWLRLWDIANGVPASAAILADWQLREEMKRLHLIRHHLLIEGYPSPLPMIALNEITDSQKGEVADKVVELMTPQTRP